MQCRLRLAFTRDKVKGFRLSQSQSVIVRVEDVLNHVIELLSLGDVTACHRAPVPGRNAPDVVEPLCTRASMGANNGWIRDYGCPSIQLVSDPIVVSAH